ncbi:transketolase [Boudabousia liubingyangii]|uniref:Transketolase n=1 Tax=Boudabousia liubingyangii TaxID=1921764 RepID=A0A1Q5PNG1_9ACTO|nr:transketolase [Boudabousia liubingyangii]OKL49091.1 transketolase [Boudabousia liubingyangii]
MPFAWNERDDRAVTMLKALAADAVEEVGNGHPGTAISLAAVAYVVYRDHLRYDPKDPHWLGRDRFVLSIGHASLIQYSQLFLHGLGLEIDDLKHFRQAGSLTPGHPEVGHTDFVEISTGPLGSGIASAVGMAMAARRSSALLDPNTPNDESLFNHRVYVMMGDGDMQEGVTHEACALAGTQQLGNLIAIYDDNQISIEGGTSIAFTEDVQARFEAYGWHTQFVDFTAGPDGYFEDVEALHKALAAAEEVQDRPSLIRVRTIIGHPSPNKQNTGGIHGSKLGAEELAGLKEALGLNPEEHFFVDEEVLASVREDSAARGRELRAAWDERFATWQAENPEEAKLLERLLAKQLPEGFREALPTFDTKALATRAASGAVINALAPVVPELWGGSADLAGSNNTIMKGEASFFPESRSTKDFQGSIKGRNLHLGIREHGMGMILNGIALSNLFLPYGGTFLVFSDYMRGAVRLAALMELPVTYVFTHDSIGVGEDGPTHQPVEHLSALRAIPGLSVVRPADANETAEAWASALERRKPAVLALTRQNLPCPDRKAEGLAPASELAKGAYILRDLGEPQVVLMATGSEVQLALGAQEKLQEAGIGSRVVSAPCLEWFDEQPEDYRLSVLPKDLPKVAIEAGVDQSWYKYLEGNGTTVTMSSFGAPGAANVLFEKFGFTVDNVVAKAQELL